MENPVKIVKGNSLEGVGGYKRQSPSSTTLATKLNHQCWEYVLSELLANGALWEPQNNSDY